MSHYRSWGSTENGQIEFESLSDKTLEGALDVMRKNFFLYESLAIGVELTSEPGATEELEELCLQAAKDGVTLVAVDINTSQVVGVAFNKIQVSSSEKNVFEHFTDNCRYKSSKYFVDIMGDMESRINLFKHYDVNCSFEIMFLSILPTYKRRRIGEMLVSSSLELAKELKRGKNVRVPIVIHGSNKVTNADAVPSLVFATMTSNYSYRIAMKLHFDKLLEVPYDEFVFNGKKFSEKVNPVHRGCIVVAKKVSI